MRILIGKALQHFNMLEESVILCKQGNISLFLTLKEHTMLNFFITNVLYKINIVEKHTNMRATSYKLKLSHLAFDHLA